MRLAARVDATHREVVDALRDLSWLVLDLSRVGKGCPDLLGWHRRHGLTLFEVKAAKGKLSEGQRTFQTKGWPVVMLRSVEDVIAFTREGAA